METLLICGGSEDLHLLAAAFKRLSTAATRSEGLGLVLIVKPRFMLNLTGELVTSTKPLVDVGAGFCWLNQTDEEWESTSAAVELIAASRTREYRRVAEKGKFGIDVTNGGYELDWWQAFGWREPTR